MRDLPVAIPDAIVTCFTHCRRKKTIGSFFSVFSCTSFFFPSWKNGRKCLKTFSCYNFEWVKHSLKKQFTNFQRKIFCGVFSVLLQIFNFLQFFGEQKGDFPYISWFSLAPGVHFSIQGLETNVDSKVMSLLRTRHLEFFLSSRI